LEEVLWSYIVIIITLIFIIFMIRPLFRYTHPGLVAMYLVATAWIIYLFVTETITLYNT
jgi:hypothetical protein